MSQSAKNNWHIDRTINIGTLIAVTAYAIGFAWYMAKADARIDAATLATASTARALEQYLAQQKGDRDKTTSEISELKVTMTQIGTKVDMLLNQSMSVNPTVKR